MTPDSEKAEAVEQLLETPDLATALESEQFKKFLDQVPIAIAVSSLAGKERVVYANPEFEKLSGRTAAELTRQNWAAIPGLGLHQQKDLPLAEAVVGETDFVGTFRLERHRHERPADGILPGDAGALNGVPRSRAPLEQDAAADVRAQ